MAATVRTVAVRTAGAAGALVACGVSGLVVAANTKPADMPLRPPVDPRAPLAQPASSSAGQTTLVIPPTAVCGRTGRGASGTAAGAGVPATLDPALRQALQELRQAPDAASRRAVLQMLTPDQRQQLTALVQAMRRRATGTGGGGCAASGGGAAVATPVPGPSLAPAVTGGGDVTPITISAVS